MKAYDIVDKRSGSDRVEEAICSTITRESVIIARNAAYVEMVEANMAFCSRKAIYFSGRLDALNELLG